MALNIVEVAGISTAGHIINAASFVTETSSVIYIK